MRNTPLHRALQFDGAASGATALLLLLASTPLASLFGLPAGLLLSAGLVMLPFVALIVWLAARAEPPRRGVQAVILLNAMWVLDSLLLLASGWVAPTGLGVSFVLAQAAAVALFALLQWQGLRQPRHAALA